MGAAYLLAKIFTILSIVENTVILEFKSDAIPHKCGLIQLKTQVLFTDEKNTKMFILLCVNFCIAFLHLS